MLLKTHLRLFQVPLRLLKALHMRPKGLLLVVSIDESLLAHFRLAPVMFNLCVQLLKLDFLLFDILLNLVKLLIPLVVLIVSIHG